MSAQEQIIADPSILVYGGLELIAIILVGCALVGLTYWYLKKKFVSVGGKGT